MTVWIECILFLYCLASNNIIFGYILNFFMPNQKELQSLCCSLVIKILVLVTSNYVCTLQCQYLSIGKSYRYRLGKGQKGDMCVEYTETEDEIVMCH
jgi:hypothetical protein